MFYNINSTISGIQGFTLFVILIISKMRLEASLKAYVLPLHEKSLAPIFSVLKHCPKLMPTFSC